MKVDYVAFDSFGIKSSCTKITTPDCTITLDPGIAIEASSYPSPLAERFALVERYLPKIKAACRASGIVTVSHYHYDHHNPDVPELYKDKIVLMKDPKANINKSQRTRAAYFLEKVKPLAKELRIADGNEFEFGSTKIIFSEALWHGVERSRVGKVIMTLVDDGKQRLLHSSDIDGPVIEDYVELIASYRPDIIVLDGAPTYLLGYLVAYRNVRRAISNTIELLKKSSAKIILDHHLLRDYRYRELYAAAFDAAKRLGRTMHTAAEELGKEPDVLRAHKRYGGRWRAWKPLDHELAGKAERAVKLRSGR